MKKSFPLESPSKTLPALVEPGMTSAGWEKERADIRGRIMEMLGKFPSYPQVTHKILGETSLSGGKAYEVLLPSAPGESISALLFVPDRASVERCPAVVAPHPTNYDFKYCFLERDCNTDQHYPYALDLMKRGFVVIAPDIFAVHDVDHASRAEITKYYCTVNFEKKYPDWTPVGRMFYDHSICVSFLSALPYVDAGRIGAIGHSLGGHNTLLLTALDERVAAGVSSCGYTSFVNNPAGSNWARDEGFCYFPTLREPFKRGHTPIEFYEILALCAPRAFMTWQTTQDIWMPNHEYVTEADRHVREVYKLYNCAEKLVLHMAQGDHSFPENARVLAYDFLEANLGKA